MLYCTSDTKVTLWKIEDKGKYSEGNVSTSRKNKETNEYVNSNFAFWRFVGKAHNVVKNQPDKTKITNLTIGITREPYMKDGVKTFAKEARYVVFDCELVDKAPEYMPSQENDSESDLPF